MIVRSHTIIICNSTQNIRLYWLAGLIYITRPYWKTCRAAHIVIWYVWTSLFCILKITTRARFENSFLFLFSPFSETLGMFLYADTVRCIILKPPSQDPLPLAGRRHQAGREEAFSTTSRLVPSVSCAGRRYLLQVMCPANIITVLLFCQTLSRWWKRLCKSISSACNVIKI